MEEMLNLLKLFANETNLRIIQLFVQTSKEICVCEISDVLDLPAYDISRSLSKLKRNGFINSRKHNKFVYYKKEGALIDPLKKKLISLIKNLPEASYEKDIILLRKRLSMRKDKNCACIIEKAEWKREANFILNRE